MDFLKHYYLENYLFDTVRLAFHSDGSLSAFDFFCIVIWKADRAKSVVARRLLALQRGDLETTVRAITNEIFLQPTPEERMRILWSVDGWGFRLPMASAILTVLYPDDFTVYDVRVCEALGGRFAHLGDATRFDSLWSEYTEFKAAVESAAPVHLSLRDKDRWLWGKSFQGQLKREILSGFANSDSKRISTIR